MLGPGKYDAICTLVREQEKAMGAVVIIFNGERGSGFSAQVPKEAMPALVHALKAVAAQMEEDLRRQSSPPNDESS